MLERNSGMMRKALFEKNMTIETSHSPDREHTNGAERPGIDIEHFPIRNISLDVRFGGRLNAENGNRTGFDLPFQRSSRDIGFLSPVPSGDA